MNDRKLTDAKHGAFIHATYVVGNWIKNRAQLDETRFEQFSFMYVMAGPDWKAEDFDLPEDVVMHRLVDNHSYPTGSSGRALVPELIALAQQEKVKVLVSIPGSEQFNPVVSDGRKRACFARVMAAFVRKHGYDGIEIDWEHTIDIDQHAVLMVDLRKALEAPHQTDGVPSRHYFLTTALHIWREYSPAQARQLANAVDWVNLMTYDMGGGIWGCEPSHNTPLNGMKEALNHWSVFPPNKICIGLANYGFRYKGISPGQKCETSLKEKGSYFSYTELPALLESGWLESYDNEAQAPYYISPDKTEFVTIDSKRSLSRKLEWVRDEQYLGVFWWEFHSDCFPPDAGQQYARHPLIDHVTDAIRTFESAPRD